MDLFLREGDIQKTEEMVLALLERYVDKHDLKCGDVCIARTDSGKPFFKGAKGVHFSVSHSGQMWVCLMATNPVGIDIQKAKAASPDKVAERFFTRDEALYIKSNGEDAFLDVWTRKEAASKCIDMTLASTIGKLQTVVDGRLLGKISYQGSGMMIKGLDIADGIKCAVAVSCGANVRADEIDDVEMIWI